MRQMLNTDWEWSGLSRWRGWRWPTVPITSDLIRHNPEVEVLNPYHVRVHYDFDRSTYVMAWWLFAPLVRFWYWWTRYRWIIERTLRGRIFDIREGDHCANWKLRPLRRWSLGRTR